MVLENIDWFQSLIYEKYHESKFGPEKSLRALKFLIPVARMGLEMFGFFCPLVIHRIAGYT